MVVVVVVVATTMVMMMVISMMTEEGHDGSPTRLSLAVRERSGAVLELSGSRRAQTSNVVRNSKRSCLAIFCLWRLSPGPGTGCEPVPGKVSGPSGAHVVR